MLLVIIMAAGFSSCGSSSPTRETERVTTRTQRDAPASIEIPQKQGFRGKMQVNYVDIVTLSLRQREVEVYFDQEEGNYTLELPMDNGIIYSQKWNEENRTELIDAILRYSVDENRQRHGKVDTRAFTHYNTLDGLTKWRNPSNNNTYTANPSIDLGYLVYNGNSYFAITQRDSVVTEGDPTGNLRSQRIVFCMATHQARQMIELVGGILYEKPIILFLGDSVTIGRNATIADEDDPANAYPAILQEVLKISVLNSGANWETTDETLERVKTDVLKYDPDIIVLHLGYTDFLNRVPPQATSRNIQNIITFLMSEGPFKLFLTRFYDEKILRNSMNYWNLTQAEQTRLMAEYDTIFQNLSRTNNIPLISNIWEGVDYGDTIGEDYINPTAEGQKIMAGNFFRAMRPFFQENDYIR